MNQILIIQLLTSFFVGGAFIAMLTFIAEKSDEKISGIIMTLPSTIALGFFFLGLSVSPQEAAKVVPATLVPLGIMSVSIVIYIYIAEFFSKLKISKTLQIFSTFVLSSLIWFILAAPFAIFKFSNLPVAITGYLTLMLFSHFLLSRKTYSGPALKIKYTNTQKVYRAVFIGLLIAIVVFLAKTLDAFWGGVFVMFPAATFAALIFFHQNHSPQKIFQIMKRAPLGMTTLFVYSLMVFFTFPSIGVVFGSITSYAVSLVYAFALSKF